ncbi:MAG TPA: tetratricopeptide repeat protein, partial [Candidatus Obscuribacter sp.]|nr:tetratricopeptide repeat protein [Candidatus Obscuribacter sp.]
MIKWPTPDPPDPKAKNLRRTAANRPPGKLALLAIRKQRLIQMTRWQNQNQTLAEILRIAALRTLTLCTAALSIATSCSMASAQTTEKQRPPKDLKYRKRVIVGPDGGDIPRRIDYQALSTRDTLMLPTYVPAAAARHAIGGFDTGSNTFSRDGIVPPPPPMKSALLPKSIAPLPQEETATARSISPPQRTIAHVPLSQARLVQIKTEAQILFKKGKLAEAQALLSRYVSEYPQEASLKTELAKVSLARAKAHVKQGDHANAAKQARLAVSHSHDVSPEIASAADQALDASLQKLGVNPKDAAQRSNLGDKLSAQHRHLEAEVEYRTAARLKPSETAHIKAGNAAAAAGHNERAKASYQSALEINPDSSNALKKLGITRLQMRDYVGASADLTRALVINQGDKEAAHALISLWKEQVASRPQDANSHLGLARAYQVSGELAQAQAEYKIVVQLNPVHPHLPAARQSFKLALAKQEALKSFQSAKTMEAQGNLTGAYQKATDAVGLFPSDTNYKDYWLSLANKIRARGEELPTQTVGGNTSAISPQVMEQIRALAMPGEQPPTLNLPTAQAIGLAQSPAAVQAAQAAPVSMTHENGYRPLNTDTHVASIANFLDSMRTFTLQQQAEIDKNTQAVRQSLKAATSGIMGAPTAGSTADPSLPSAGESGAGASGSSGSVVGATTEAVTAQGTGSALSSATAATPQAALASAAAALANTKMDTAAPPMTITGMALGAGQNYAADKSFLSSVSGMAATAAPTLMSGKMKAFSKADVQNALNMVAKQSKAKASKAAASTSQPAPSLPPQATPIPAALPSLSAQAQPLELNK